MLIDWFTVAAQALNFLILVWLLKRLLYKPILAAIDAREQRIAAELSAADASRAEARKEREELQTKSQAFDAQRGALLSTAVEGARAERERLLGEARTEVDRVRVQQQAALRSERQRLGAEITRRTTAEVFGIARRALADLATVSLEERLAEVFTRRLRGLDAPTKSTLAAALKSASEPALVRSTFELPPAQQAAIRNALNETFSADIPLRFATAPEAICGIELTVNGQRLAWNIADYLGSLEHTLGALLDAQPAPSA